MGCTHASCQSCRAGGLSCIRATLPSGRTTPCPRPIHGTRRCRVHRSHHTLSSWRRGIGASCCSRRRQGFHMTRTHEGGSPLPTRLNIPCICTIRTRSATRTVFSCIRCTVLSTSHHPLIFANLVAMHEKSLDSHVSLSVRWLAYLTTANLADANEIRRHRELAYDAYVP